MDERQAEVILANDQYALADLMQPGQDFEASKPVKIRFNHNKTDNELRQLIIDADRYVTFIYLSRTQMEELITLLIKYL